MERKTVAAGVLLAVVVLIFTSSLPGQSNDSEPPHNVIIFVTDGLRHESVDADVAPTIFRLRQQGVDFVNSHSAYPTFTTPNASVFATGHLIGDTGDFGNTLYIGHPLQNRDNTISTLTPFIENDTFLANLNEFYDGSYVGEETLMELARSNGYSTASVGKLGPTAIQDISEIRLVNNAFAATATTIADDSTGPQGIPIPAAVRTEMGNSGLSTAAPDRTNGQPESSRGSNSRSAGTLAANFSQQQYFANVVTQAVLPSFKKEGKPFFLLFWSRDPDGTQHNQADSLDQLSPGINGPTSRAAIRNTDNNLWQIIDYLKANDLYATTDIIVVADHGFSTISRREISRTGVPTTSYAAGKLYLDVKEGYLPPGFLAIDLAHALNKPLYDPDAPFYKIQNSTFYQAIDVCSCPELKLHHHPASGNGILGGSGRVPEGSSTPDAEIIVAANGGSGLIYLPQQNAESNKQLARSIADFLLKQDYTDGVFVRDDLGDLPGTLPLSAIGLVGSTRLPKPAFIVNFKSFSLGGNPLLSRIEIADTGLQEGQGMHGSFSRADTYNNMVAAGPDFKPGYVDRAPVSNADIAVTVAAILKWSWPAAHGKLHGRIMSEAIKGGPDNVNFSQPAPRASSTPGADGRKTVLHFQQLEDYTYYDQACLRQAVPSATMACN